jgi:hypothetical protein
MLLVAVTAVEKDVAVAAVMAATSSVEKAGVVVNTVIAAVTVLQWFHQ